jgi:hypothetical protein
MGRVTPPLFLFSMSKIGTVLNLVPDVEIKPVKTLDYSIQPFIPFGSDNLFPQATALFARSSPVHRGVINSKCNYMLGDGLTSEDKKIQYLFDKANFEGETIDKIASKYFRDKNTGGNAWMEIITDNRRSFLWFNHIDFTKCRLSKDGKSCLIHPDWTDYKGMGEIKSLPIYPEFLSERNEYGVIVSRSVIQVKEYEPEFYYYGIPSWVAGKDSMMIDLKTNKWNLARLKNAFKVSGFLIVPVKDSKEGEEVINYIEDNHIGEDKQAKLMVLTKSRAQEGEKADAVQFVESKQDDEGSWDKLHSSATNDIVIAHSWFRSLTSIADNTGFDTKRILNEYAIARQTIIQHEQTIFLDVFKKVFKEQMGLDIDLQFINKPPIAEDSWLMIWEARRNRGEVYNENDPNQQKIIIPQGYALNY